MTPRPPHHWSNHPLPEKTVGWLWGCAIGMVAGLLIDRILCLMH